MNGYEAFAGFVTMMTLFGAVISIMMFVLIIYLLRVLGRLAHYLTASGQRALDEAELARFRSAEMKIVLQDTHTVPGRSPFKPVPRLPDPGRTHPQ